MCSVASLLDNLSFPAKYASYFVHLRTHKFPTLPPLSKTYFFFISEVKQNIAVLLAGRNVKKGEEEIDNHIEKGEIMNIDLRKSKEIPLNALLEIASSTEVKSVLNGVAGTFNHRAGMATGDFDLTIVVEFRAYDDAIVGRSWLLEGEKILIEKDDPDFRGSSELVLCTEIKCKEDHDEVDEDYYEQWADRINDYMNENITKLPSELQTWVEDTYTAALMLNGVVVYY